MDHVVITLMQVIISFKVSIEKKENRSQRICKRITHTYYVLYYVVMFYFYHYYALFYKNQYSIMIPYLIEFKCSFYFFTDYCSMYIYSGFLNFLKEISKGGNWMRLVISRLKELIVESNRINLACWHI